MPETSDGNFSGFMVHRPTIRNKAQGSDDQLVQETRRRDQKIPNISSRIWEDQKMEELDSYLKLAKACVWRMPKTSPWKFNIEQCGYLIDKLKVVVESASLFLEIIGSKYYKPHSPVDITKKVEIFNLLLSLASQIETFVQGCCKEAWIEAAMTLTNVSEYISSLGFNLELCKTEFIQYRAPLKCLTYKEVYDIYKTEVEIVETKALVDVKTLVQNVTSEMNALHGENRDLASYLVQRLLRFKINPTSNEESIWKVVVRQMRGLFKLVVPTQQLGRGASATVDKAMWLGTPVAQKTFIGPENSEFLREVKNLLQLFHPNITSMYCCTKNERSCSIIMELMDGDLHRLVETRWKEGNVFQPFPILEAIDIMLQIGEGVNYLHSKRIVHRDLKSMNILVKSINVTEKSKIGYRHVKVADFGLSKTKEKSITFSTQTYNTGTNRWMAPEIISLNQSHPKILPKCYEMLKYPFKCDIYSFGMVCYEILTGCIPFVTISDLNDIKKKIKEGERPKLPNDCPYKLQSLIEKCWNQEPKDRPTANEICSELKYLKYLLMKGCDVVEGEVEARCEVVKRDVNEHLGSFHWELTDTFMSPLTASWGIAISPSRNLVATASSNKLCHVYDVHLHNKVAILAGHLDSLWAVKFSPTNQELVGTTSFDHTCRLWNVNTQKCLHVFKGHKKEVFGLSFQHGTNRLATASRDTTSMIWDVEHGHPILTLKGHTCGVWNVCFQPNNGHLLATSSYDCTAKLWDPRSSKSVHNVMGHCNVIAGLDIDESGTFLATGSWDKTCQIHDLRFLGSTGSPSQTLPILLETHGDRVNQVAFSPNGKLLATTSDDKAVRLFNTTTWRCDHILSSHLLKVLDVAWSPTSDYFVSASYDSIWKLWQLKIPSKNEQPNVVSHPTPATIEPFHLRPKGTHQCMI